VLIALAPEVDLRYERLYGYLQDDVNRRCPTVDLVLDLITRTPAEKIAGRAAFGAESDLVENRIVWLVPEQRAIPPPLLAHAVKVDDQIIDGVLGQSGLDRRLPSFCRLLAPAVTHPADPGAAGADRGRSDATLKGSEYSGLVRLVRSALGVRPLRVHFRGPAGSGRLAAAEAVAGELGVPLLVLDLAQMLGREPPSTNPLAGGGLARDDVLNVTLREAQLLGAVLYLDDLDASGEDPAKVHRWLAERLAAYPGVVILAGARPWTSASGPPLGLVHVSFAEGSFATRCRAWRRGLVSVPAPDEVVDLLAGRYRLTVGQIRDAVAEALEAARWRAAVAGAEPAGIPVPTRTELVAAARRQGGHELAQSARRIDPMYSWGDLVLPTDSIVQLRELCDRVALREQVLNGWGFAGKLSQGRGCAALFTGPPGTGKTMAAEVIAGELGLDLFKIDLSTVISKYIGETEKNLERIFTAADRADAILLFDEADALFGKRSEVKDSHDRYANIETAYLLQRMEQYDGVAILATNQREHLDEAFTRRLQFVVDFPFPDDDQRRRIWEVCFPADAPVDPELDLVPLGRDYRMAGGNIKNAVLHAAYLAAARGSPIGMDELLQAVRREHQKMGKVLAYDDPPGTPDPTTLTRPP
jgi:AAA+ superfamily predicted ATPase